ncbi:MAG: YhbY family RNA-binding protein [Anaeroplasmataceae bacterium]
MLTPKQKAYLKSLANPLKPVFQIGKDGISDEMKYSIVNCLMKNELIKVSILQNSDCTMEEACEIFEDVNIEIVQTIGRTIVLYKKSNKAKNPIVFPNSK